MKAKLLVSVIALCLRIDHLLKQMFVDSLHNKGDNRTIITIDVTNLFAKNIHITH